MPTCTLTYACALYRSVRTCVSQKLVEDLEDAGNEIMLSDEEVVKYTIGECFVHIERDAAEERLTAEAGRAGEELEQLRGELEDINKEMGVLKQQLYSKFKDQINLEDS